ncbi:MAG: hypothetical protein RLP14_02210 [Owenweeksia sp.]
MKKTFLLLLTIGIFSSVKAQLYTPGGSVSNSSNNNIGIRVSNPSAVLHIQATASHGGLRIDGASGTGPAVEGEDPDPVYSPYLIDAHYSSASVFFVKYNGATYIGSGINSWSNANNYLNTKGNIGIFSMNDEFLKLDYINTLRGASVIWSTRTNSYEKNLNFRYGSNTATPIMTLSPDGVVGINATSFNGDYKLYVGGKILSEELTVKLQQDWPDFVFEEDYCRMSLEEIESFIDQNGHLPNVPSASEVAEKGVSVGEMQAILLQKIEELTLELISLKKELNQQEAK